MRRAVGMDSVLQSGVESRGPLGRYRWMVEHALSWLNRFRRLRVRFERRVEIHQAFFTPACARLRARLLAGAPPLSGLVEVLTDSGLDKGPISGYSLTG